MKQEKQFYYWTLNGIDIPTKMTYRMASNELIVSNTIDDLNCTSFLASVFLDRINCVRRIVLPSKSKRAALVEAFKKNYQSGKIKSFVSNKFFPFLQNLASGQSINRLTNPAACRSINVLSPKYRSVSDLFKAFMEYEIERRKFRGIHSGRKTNMKMDSDLFKTLNGDYVKEYYNRLKQLKEGSVTGYGLRAKALQTLPTGVSRLIGLLGGRRTRKRRTLKKRMTRRR